MTGESQFVYVDQEVSSKLLSLISEAKEFLVVVTPYLKLDRWQHA